MVRKNSRKKGGAVGGDTACLENLQVKKGGGGDTACLENLQEQHNQLMDSFRSLLSVEVSFLFPTMAGIQHLDNLNELSQAVLLVSFLILGCIGTVALILSHSTNAMRWSSVVSCMALVVTSFWLGIFHFTIGLLIPESYMKAYIRVNIVLYPCIVLLIGSQWKIFFRPPKCGEKTPNENSRKKDDDAKRLVKLQEQHNKLMTSFRSLLSTEVSFMFPSIVEITHLDKFGEQGHAALLVSFLLMGYIGTIALILSHSTDAMKWSTLVSILTVVVTIHWLGIFHFSVALLSPEAYRKESILVYIFLFIGSALFIGCLWGMFFQLPKYEAKED